MSNIAAAAGLMCGEAEDAMSLPRAPLVEEGARKEGDFGGSKGAEPLTFSLTEPRGPLREARDPPVVRLLDGDVNLSSIRCICALLSAAISALRASNFLVASMKSPWSMSALVMASNACSWHTLLNFTKSSNTAPSSLLGG